MGTYRVGLGANFGLTGNGKFGNDTVGLGTGAGANAINIDKQAVVAYATSDVWVGQLGLSKWALNMSDTVSPHSFLSRLKEGGYIPSLSFGYQAGAFYRESNIYVLVYLLNDLHLQVSHVSLDPSYSVATTAPEYLAHLSNSPQSKTSTSASKVSLPPSQMARQRRCSPLAS
jgi:hypothetical protein